MAGDWTPEPFEAGDGSIPFERFVNDLSNFKFDAVTVAIDRILTVQGIDLVRTEWLKALGEGLHEFRIRHTAAEVARLFGGVDVAPPAGPTEKVLLRALCTSTVRRSSCCSAATTRATTRKSAASNVRSSLPGVF
jgi:hypothetical protein